MARPRKQLLHVGLKFDKRDGSFRLRWGRRPGVILLPLGRVPPLTARRKQMAIQAALAGESRWPDWALRVPAVRAYAAGHKDEIRAIPCGDLYAAYAAHLGPQVSRAWRLCILGHLRELQAFGRARGEADLDQIRPATAQAWISSIPETPGPFQKAKGARSATTANRALAAVGGFYRWAVRLGHLVASPVAGIQQLPEPDQEIVFLTLEERNQVLAAAVEEPDGIAVWIALLAGLRRKEIAELAWERVNLLNRKLEVVNTKTPKKKKREARRTIDIATALQTRLEKTPPARRRGAVVPWPEETARWQYVADELIERLRARLRLAESARVKSRKRKSSWIDKVGWNVFRHTFCTLHAQAGVPPFTICGWSGHSLEIFLKHYAAHLPTYDDRIDLVDRLYAEQAKRGRHSG